jgi:hypothetical protein
VVVEGELTLTTDSRGGEHYRDAPPVWQLRPRGFWPIYASPPMRPPRIGLRRGLAIVCVLVSILGVAWPTLFKWCDCGWPKF